MNALILVLAGALSGNPMDPLQAVETVIDCGEVKAGKPLSRTFALRNRGPTAITIVRINAGCGCLKPRISKEIMAPGETSELSVALNTISQDVGPNLWKVTVCFQYGDGAERASGELELSIKGRIIRELNIEPVALSMAIEREATHTITVTDRRAKPLTITSVKCGSKHVQTRLTAAGVNSQGQRVQQVRVTILDTLPPGHLVEQLVMATDDPEYPDLRIPLMVARRVAGQAVATPEQIDLRLAKGQRAASGLVRLQTPDEKPVVIDRIEADHPDIRFKWVVGPGSMVTLRLGVELDGQPSSGLGTVKVLLKGPRAQTVLIPVSWQAP
jgi:hypothetical protein